MAQSWRSKWISCDNLVDFTLVIAYAVLRDNKWVEPLEFWENADTKRRLQNLLIVSGLIDSLAKVKARPATKSEITLFHTEEYYSNIVEQTKKGIRKVFLRNLLESYVLQHKMAHLVSLATTQLSQQMVFLLQA